MTSARAKRELSWTRTRPVLKSDGTSPESDGIRNTPVWYSTDCGFDGAYPRGRAASIGPTTPMTSVLTRIRARQSLPHLCSSTTFARPTALNHAPPDSSTSRLLPGLTHLEPDSFQLSKQDEVESLREARNKTTEAVDRRQDAPSDRINPGPGDDFQGPWIINRFLARCDTTTHTS